MLSRLVWPVWPVWPVCPCLACPFWLSGSGLGLGSGRQGCSREGHAQWQASPANVPSKTSLSPGGRERKIDSGERPKIEALHCHTTRGTSVLITLSLTSHSLTGSSLNLAWHAANWQHAPTQVSGSFSCDACLLAA